MGMDSLTATVDFFSKLPDVYFCEKIPEKGNKNHGIEVLFEKKVWRVLTTNNEWKRIPANELISLLVVLKADIDKFELLLRGVIKEKQETYKVLVKNIDLFLDYGKVEDMIPMFRKKHLILIPGGKE